jgi:hypothetical protein
LQLGNGQTRIVGHDDDRRLLEDAVQLRDELFLFSSIHLLSPVGEIFISPVAQAGIG